MITYEALEPPLSDGENILSKEATRIEKVEILWTVNLLDTKEDTDSLRCANEKTCSKLPWFYKTFAKLKMSQGTMNSVWN